MRAFSPATPPARRPTSVVAFNPASISGLRSRLLDANTFTSLIGGRYYLEDSSTTNTHLPRQGRCWLFDGSNDHGTIGVNPPAMASGAMFARLKPAGGSAIQFLFCSRDPDRMYLGLSATNKIYITLGTTNFTHSVVETGWINVAVNWSGGNFKVFRDGVQIHSGAYSGTVAGTAFRMGIYESGTSPFKGYARDLRLYNAVKSDAEMLAITNGADDSTGLYFHFPCNEESGTTGYDISGNGRNLTLTNITQATFHAADNSVLVNRNNAEGYRLSGSVYIPKRLTDSLAADGNALTVTGRAAYHGCAETPCVTNHTGTVYIAAAHLTGSETVVSFSGSTTTPTISAGRIDWQSGQTLSDLTLSDGTRYTMQEGSGSGNTNRTIYNVNGSTNHGTLTNGTVATIWGTRLSGTVQDWCILYGGRIGAAGEFVPGRVSGSLAADGSAKTLAAGKFGNPFSRLNLNPATAAELNGRSVPTTAAAGADINATITPTDSGFRRTASDGDDRILLYDDTLSGADLSNVEGYVA